MRQQHCLKLPKDAPILSSQSSTHSALNSDKSISGDDTGFEIGADLGAQPGNSSASWLQPQLNSDFEMDEGNMENEESSDNRDMIFEEELGQDSRNDDSGRGGPSDTNFDDDNDDNQSQDDVSDSAASHHGACRATTIESEDESEPFDGESEFLAGGKFDLWREFNEAKELEAVLLTEDMVKELEDMLGEEESAELWDNCV